MAPVLHIRLLGDCSLCYDGASATDVPVTEVNTSRLRSLLAYLLLHRQAPQPRSHVAFQFWPDSTESQAHSNLRTLLHRLRQALPAADQFISVEGQTLQWRRDAPYTLDVASFEQSMIRADQTEQAGDGAAVRAALEQAIDLYGGDLLPSCYDDWILPERERLHQAYIRAMDQLIQVLEEAREYDQAIRHAQRLVGHDPLHEAAYRRLMRLRALNGDRAGALRIYHTCATTLQRELGVEPSPATQRAYEQVLRVEPRPEPVGQAPSAISLLVGREEEWTQLQTTWRRSARGPRFALLLGEAGIGKTRLVEELLHWAERRGIACAYARCYAAEGELAYAPVTALLQARPLPPLEDVWLSEVARLLPEVLAERPDLPPPRPMTEAWQRQRLFQALVRAVLGNNSPPEPLLLAVEDLQWCDRESLDWLHYLLRFDPRAQILVIGTCRPEELAGGCPFSAALPALHRDVRLTEIELGPLDEAQTKTLAANVAGQALDEAVARRLHRETEGNPLFVVETLRAGLPVPQEEFEAEELHLPPRVQAVLETRLAQLTPPARDLAGLAATVGRAFTFPVLRAAGNGDEDALVLGLDELWQRRIVRVRAANAYDFSHDKLREVAYGSLGPVRRQLLHRRVAQALEAVHAPELDVVARRVAVHYDRAGLVEQAIPRYVQAGHAASRIYAREQAVASFRRGLVLLEEGSWDAARQDWYREVMAQLYEGLGDALQFSQPDAARLAYQNAVQEAPRDDLLKLARLHRKIGDTWHRQGEFEKSLRACSRAETCLGPEQPGPSADWWREWLALQYRRFQSIYALARWREMVELIERIRPAIDQHGAAADRGWFYTGRTVMAMRRDRYVISDATLADARTGWTEA